MAESEAVGKAKPALGAVGPLLLKPPVPGRPRAWEQSPGRPSRGSQARAPSKPGQTTQSAGGWNEEAQRSRAVSHAVRQGLAEGAL